MNGHHFLRIVSVAFRPFLLELGFEKEHCMASGRHYSASFETPEMQVCISHEPGNGICEVYIFNKIEGRWSSIDNRIDTPRLSDLNRRFFSRVSREERMRNFSHMQASDSEEARLLKAAKELRLVLPMFLEST